MISKRQGIIATFFGTTISVVNAIVQFLTIYYILEKFGTTFNGFVKVSSTFSFLVASSDSAIGISTTLLLVKPIANNDWISANEIYSASRKSYIKNAITGLICALIISLAYSFFICFQSNGSTITNINFSSINLKSKNNEISIFVLISISMIYSLRYLLMAIFFNSYENILAACNKNGIIKLCILMSDIVCFAIMLILLIDNNYVNPILVFLPIFLSSIIRGLLITFYVKRQFKWIKYYKEFNSYRVEENSKKISLATIGQQIIFNTDVIVVSLLFGLNVSSALSLYLVVALNTRIVMKNFIVSFREYFIMLISKNGRIKWESYCKYELYTTIIALFTFINLSILSPYFVTALYGNSALDNILKPSDIENVKYILISPSFSLIYAFSSFIDIIIESQYLLIKSKGRSSEITKFQLIISIVYILSIFIICPIVLYTSSTINSIKFMFIFKTLILIVLFVYLYRYIWKYVTYNSSAKYTLNNLVISAIIIVISSIVQFYLCGKWLNVEKYALISNWTNKDLIILVELFFSSIFISFLLIISVSFMCSPKIMIGIFSSLPLIGRLAVFKRKEKNDDIEKTEKINLFDIDNDIKGEIEKIKLENNITSYSNKKIYKIKG